MSRRRRAALHLLVGALLAQVLAVSFVLAPSGQRDASAAAQISLTKDGPATVLAGGEATYTLTASNPGDVVEYNASFSDLLPLDVTYVPGTVEPASAGEPTVSTDPVTGRQLLVWSNVADLPPGATTTVTFTVQFDEPDAVVGSSALNSSTVAANTDPRQVPDFDASGTPVPGSFSDQAQASHSTVITALAISKSSTGTPEGELLRGVHDQRSTYTLHVENTAQSGTDGVVVVDLLPANLEFLGCGDVDNTRPPSAVEYPGAPRLGVPPISPSGCLAPVSVDTVLDPPAANGVAVPAGIYTEVTWDLGDLAPGAAVDITYVAGIPLLENTLTFSAGPTPSAGSLGQAANLNNNNGASTRETGTERGATNLAGASGTYTGPTVDPDPTVTVDTSHSVTVEDVRMRKSVSPAEFSSEAGSDVATFTLTTDTSEYVTAADLELVDTLPGAYCPLGGSANYAPGAPAECDPGGGSPPTGAGYDSVTFDATAGAFTIRFELADLGEDDTATVTFQARMRDTYAGGPHDGQPTVAGDTFTNRAAVSGTTSPVAGTGESGEQAVSDDGTATQSTAAPSVDKQTKPRDPSNLYSGDPLVDSAVGTAPAYGQSSTFTPTERTFRAGDLICFRLTMTFPDSVATRAPVVSDFVPFDTRYVTGSWAVTPANDVTIGTFGVTSSSPSTPADTLAWQLGDDDGGVRFVQPGATFDITFAVEVVDPAQPPVPDLLGNLMKARSTDSDGTVYAARDYEDFDVAPGANMTLEKGVWSVDAPASGPNPPNTDGSIVEEGSSATFRIDLQNLGRDGYPGADFSVRGVQTWDVLPVGIDSADVGDYGVVTHGSVPPATALSPTPLTQHVGCTDPGDPGHPDVSPAYGDPAAQSVIVWAFPAPDLVEDYSIFVGESMTLTYTMQLPSQIGVSTRFDNDAGVAQFGSFTNIADVTADYYPADNVSADRVDLENSQAADDPSWVTTASTNATKSQVTSVVESNNDLSTQATIGELVTYTVGVTVPAHTTVYDGVLSDPMPTGLSFVSATGIAVPGGGGVDPATGTLTFPSTYQNSTGSPETFSVEIVARVTTLGSNTQGTNRTNTASFASSLTPGGSALPARTASTTLRIVEPNPSIVKSANPTDVIGGQTVTYRLVASNTNGRPPSHDTFVVDCLPAGITFGAFTATPSGTSTSIAAGTGPAPGGNSCAVGTTLVRWDVGTVVAGTLNRKVLTYTGIVDPAAVGGQQYTNRATLTGSTLDNASPTPDPNERSYTRTSQATVTVVGLDITKGVTPTRATIGEDLDYTVTVRVPAGVNYLQTAFVDTLPPGVSTVLADTSVECTVSGTGAPCALPPALTQLPTSGQEVGLYVGDLTAESFERFITVRYTVTVLDVVGNAAGDVATNTVAARWTTDPLTPAPTTVAEAAALPNVAGPAGAAVTLLEPDLSVDKTASTTTPSGAERIDFAIDIANGVDATVSEAHDVDATDVVPDGVVVDPVSISAGGVLVGADPVRGGGSITWMGLGPLAPGDLVTVGYSATLAPSAELTGAGLTNTVAIDSYWSLPPLLHPEAREYSGPDASATVTPQFPRFVVDKTTPDGTLALVDRPFAWRVDVTDVGGAAGFAVTATDVLPPNWSYEPGSAVVTNPQPGGAPGAIEPTVTSAPGPGGSTVQTLTWSGLGDLAPGGTLRVDYRANPDPAAATVPGVGLTVPHTNTVEAGGEDATGATGNAAGSYSAGPDSAAAFLAAADLRLVKTADPVDVDAGGTAEWNIVVDNLGPDAAAAPFRVVDSIPVGTEYVPSDTSPWTCSLQSDDQTLVCTLGTPSSLASGESLPPLRIRTTVPADSLPGERYLNTASVSSPTVDPNPANNSDSADVEVKEADLAIQKSHSGTPELGDDVTFDLAVSNLGPSAAKDVVVSDTFPDGLTPATWTGGPDWTCTISGQDVRCELGADLAAGSPSSPVAAPPLTVTATVGPEAVPEVDNTATVTSSTPDPEPGNNSSTDRLGVDPVVDLWIQKAHADDFVVGAPGTFTLTVGNHGPTRDPGPITVSDTLPAGLTFVSAGGSDWSCSANGADVTCTDAGPVEVGWTSTITLVVDVGADAAPSVTNSATVSSAATDIDPANNTDDDTVAVGTDINLVLTKTVAATTNTSATWDITVRNDGPSPTVGPLVVTDPLPDGLAYFSSSGTDWSCEAAGQIVTCTYDPVLSPGESTTVRLETEVTAREDGQVIVNTAFVESTGANVTPGCPESAAGCGSAAIVADLSASRGGTDQRLALTGGRIGPLLLMAATLLAVGVLLTLSGAPGGVRRRRERG